MEVAQPEQLESRRERLMEKISKVKRKYQSTNKNEDNNSNAVSETTSKSENEVNPSPVPKKKVHYNFTFNALAEKDDDSTKTKKKQKNKKLSTKHKKDEEEEEDIKPEIEENSTINDDENINDVWSNILKNSKLTGSNYEDSVKEFLLEKLNAITDEPTNESIHQDYVTFMSELSSMFEKLRRFPKMISKFLICIRTEIMHKFDAKGDNQHNWTELLLPTQFKSSIGPIISLLPYGQIIDLWKTLHHNLEEECIKKICNNQETTGVLYFFTIVVELLSEFLTSLKVADTSVPNTQIDQMSILMLKLKDSLGQVGSALIQTKRQHSPFLISFLKLSHTWAELHSLLVLYNSKFQAKTEITTVVTYNFNDNMNCQNNSDPDDSNEKMKIFNHLSSSPSAFNLSCLHPYMESNSWIQLLENLSSIESNSSVHCAITNLVRQKVKYLRIFQEKCKLQIRLVEEQKTNLNESKSTKMDTSSLLILKNLISNHLKEGTTYLMIEQKELQHKLFDGVLYIASETLEPSKIIESSTSFVKQIESEIASKNEATQSMEIDDDGVKIEFDNDVVGNSRSSSDEQQVTEKIGCTSTVLDYNPVTCTAVIFEITREIIRRIIKMKLEKKAMKNILNNVLPLQNLTTLLQDFIIEQTGGDLQQELINKTDDKENQNTNNIMNNFLKCVNGIIDDNEESVTSSTETECSSGLIEHLLKFISSLPLEDFSKELKSFLGLFSISIFIALNKGRQDHLTTEDNLVIDLVGKIIIKTVSESRGNLVLFDVKWPKLFQVFISSSSFKNHRPSSSSSTMTHVLRAILSNIYISTKYIEEFQPILDFIVKDYKNNTSSSNVETILTGGKSIEVVFIILEFLIEEFMTSSKTSSSCTKATPLIKKHIRELTHFLVKVLQSKVEKEELKKMIDDIDRKETDDVDDEYATRTTNTSHALVLFFRASKISINAFKTLSNNTSNKSKEKENPEEENNKLQQIKKVTSIFTSIFPSFLEYALHFLIKFNKKKLLKINNEHLNMTRESAMELLHSIFTERNEGWELTFTLPENFVENLWNICIKHKKKDTQRTEKLKENSNKIQKNSIVDLLIVDMYQVSTVSEFEIISNSLMQEIDNLSSSISQEERPDPVQLKLVTNLIDKLVDVELASEKRSSRRNLIDAYLIGILNSSLHWSEYSTSTYIPILDLQCKILRRRNAMGSNEALASCFTSITSIPFKKIEDDVGNFKEVFCKVADLLNAFMVHRLDILSFRTHITLQCFQFLIETLTRRAHQQNKLHDKEIYDLRNCAHSMERICQSTKSGKKEFSRVAPYFVAILMKYFEMYTIYPAVKQPLISGCYKLLDLCDEHGVAQVNSMLNVGSREIFKTVYDLYKKFYRYTGKV